MNFYVLEPEREEFFGTKWAYGTTAKPKVYEDIGQRCPVCQETVGPLVWLPPHRIELSSAKPERWGDFLWGAGFDLMVSTRFKTIYEAEGLIGIRQFYPPAEIVRVGKRKTADLPSMLPTYHLVEIERLGPELDEEASGVVRKRLECTYCHRGYIKRWERVVIKPGSWAGEDIFFPRGLPGTCVVSERFKQVVETYRLTNTWLIPAAKYAYDEDHPDLPLHYIRQD